MPRNRFSKLGKKPKKRRKLRPRSRMLVSKLRSSLTKLSPATRPWSPRSIPSRTRLWRSFKRSSMRTKRLCRIRPRSLMICSRCSRSWPNPSQLWSKNRDSRLQMTLSRSWARSSRRLPSRMRPKMMMSEDAVLDRYSLMFPKTRYLEKIQIFKERYCFVVVILLDFYIWKRSLPVL